MRKKLIIYTVTGLIFALLIIFFVNGFYQPSAVRLYQWSSPKENPKDELEIITWNLGYGGLGKDSNFVLDGGTDWRPKSSHQKGAEPYWLYSSRARDNERNRTLITFSHFCCI